MRRITPGGARPAAATRRLVISDLHFVSGDELAHHPLALERLAPQLAWADELLINGDLFNSGSWMWDRRLREHPQYRATSWPGTVLRVRGGEVELGERELGAMVPVPAPAALQRPPRATGDGRLAALREPAP